MSKTSLCVAQYLQLPELDSSSHGHGPAKKKCMLQFKYKYITLLYHLLSNQNVAMRVLFLPNVTILSTLGNVIIFFISVRCCSVDGPLYAVDLVSAIKHIMLRICYSFKACTALTFNLIFITMIIITTDNLTL